MLSGRRIQFVAQFCIKIISILPVQESGVDEDTPEADVALVASVVMHIATTFPEVRLQDC